jgi:hypothetical protein
MKIPFDIGNKKFLLSPYTTKQEKEIILSSSFDITDLDRILDILNFKTEYELTDDEKKVILYKYREISVGDEVDVKYVCKCGQGNESVLGTTDFINNPKQAVNINQLSLELTDDNIYMFIGDEHSLYNVDTELLIESIDNLDIIEYDALMSSIELSQLKISFSAKATCLKCKYKKEFDMSSTKYIIEIMSDDNLMSLYKSYNHLIYFGNHTSEGIDNMHPFERSIFIGLLNKTKEDLNK